MSKNKSQKRTQHVNKIVVEQPVETEKVVETFETTAAVADAKIPTPKKAKAKKRVKKHSVTYKGLIKTLKEAKKEAKAEGDKKSAKAIQKLIDRAERQPAWDKALDKAYPVFVGWWRD